MSKNKKCKNNYKGLSSVVSGINNSDEYSTLFHVMPTLVLAHIFARAVVSHNLHKEFSHKDFLKAPTINKKVKNEN